MGLTLDITSMKSQVQVSRDLIRSNLKKQIRCFRCSLVIVSLLQTSKGGWKGGTWVKGLKRWGGKWEAARRRLRSALTSISSDNGEEEVGAVASQACPYFTEFKATRNRFFSVFPWLNKTPYFPFSTNRAPSEHNDINFSSPNKQMNYQRVP